MKTLIATLAVLTLLSATPSQAIDREARHVDRAQLDVANLDDADSIGGSIWSEAALADPGQRWAVLAGLGLGTISPDNAHNIDYWAVNFGLKYYLSSLTTVSALANYTNLDDRQGTERDIKGAGAILKHRIMPAGEPVSPFVKGGVWYRERSTFSDQDTSDDSVSEGLVEVGGGFEFAMNDTLTFVFEASYVNADSSDDDTEDLDGWLGAVSMQYYWF